MAGFRREKRRKKKEKRREENNKDVLLYSQISFTFKEIKPILSVC